MISSFYIDILLASKITIKVSLSALGLGLLGGMLLAFLEIGSKYFSPCVKAWTIFIRGLPEIVILFFAYYGLTLLLTKLSGHYVDINPFETGVITLALIFSAYATKIFVAAYQAVPQSNLLAGKAMGLSPAMVLWNIVLPQLFRHALPALINLWLVLLKDSSIVSLIGLHGVMHAAHLAASESFKPFNYYLFAGFIYLALTAFSTWAGKHLESYFAIGAKYG